MNLKPSEIEQTAALPQLPLPVQRPKSVRDFAGQRRGNRQRVVRRKNPVRSQLVHRLDGAHERERVGRRVESVQAPLVKQVSGVQPPPVPLEKTAVTGRVTGRVNNLQGSTAEVDAVSVVQDTRRLPLKNPIRVRAKIGGERAWLQRQTFPDGVQREGEALG